MQEKQFKMMSLLGLLYSSAVFVFEYLKVFFGGSRHSCFVGGKSDSEIKHGLNNNLVKEQPPPTVPYFEMSVRNLLNKCNLVKLFSYFGTLNSVVLLKFFRVRFAIINDVQLATECLQSVKFAGKSSSDGYCFHAQGQYGLLNTHGKKWEEQRKFCLRHLNTYGFKTRSMESLIQTEIDEFLEKLSKNEGAKISPNKLFYLPVLNSLWSLLTGERFVNDQAKIYRLTLELFDDVGRIFKLPDALLLLFPLSLKTLSWIAEFVPGFAGWRSLRKNVLELRAYLREKILSRQSQFVPGEIPEDFVDAYLQEIHRNNDLDSVFSKENGEMNLLGTLTEFFIAGGDTTATMISWCMLHLVRNPEIQREIQKELDHVVGRDRRPALEHRANCPYTQAFLWEVLRFNPVTISTTPREVSEDTKIGPYTIEKGTPVLLNIIGIHKNPKIWMDPQNFRPTRFLSEDRKTFIKSESMLAFSTGKRKCPGRQLARDNLFLFVSAICQRFRLEMDPELKSVNDLSVEPVYNGGFLVPKKFNMVVYER